MPVTGSGLTTHHNAPARPDQEPARKSSAQPGPGVHETLYQLVVEHSNELITRQTSQGIYLYASPACLLLLGYEPDELVGCSVYDMVHPDDLALAQEYYASLSGALDSAPVCYRIRRKDGQYTWLETRSKYGTALTIETRPEIVSVSRDITGQKQVEFELKQRNRELAVLQSAGVTITSSLDLRFVLDSVTKEMANLLDTESCTIAEWDTAQNIVRKVAQYDSSGWWDPINLVGDIRNLEDYPVTRSVLEDQVPIQMSIGQSTIDPAEKDYMEKTNIRSRMILPMIYQGNAAGLVELADSREERLFSYQEIYLAKWLANLAASAVENARLYQQAQQEIAERQRAEAALAEERALLAQRVEERTADISKANAELARAARLKDEFLANVSHELRTPLNTILGSAEILQLETFGQINEKQRKYVHNVDESGRHLLSLINDILDLSKAEVGKLIMEVRPVVIESVCQASLRLIKQLANKKGLQVSQAFKNLVKPTLPVDELRLKQILVNLLSNAVKFTPEGGQIGLEVVGDVERHAVHFTVWDTGIGISKADMANLFRPFVQVESSLARQYGGTGLGLSLVARMTELHGGGVSVESEVGRGSRFTVSLPWPNVIEPDSPADEAQPISEGISPAQLAEKWRDRPPVILLAEDNEESIGLLVDYLKLCGYRLIVARNGGEAVERAREENPDIILMDVQMPGMDGLEATRIIRLDPNLAKVPIIALTALAMPGDRERCLRAGVTDYRSKPLHLRGLLDTIETYLDQRFPHHQEAS